MNVGYDVYRIAHEDHRGRRHARREAGRLRAAPRPAHHAKKLQGTRRRPDLHGQPARPRRGRRSTDPAGHPTFRDRLFTEIFPGRTEVPKTLVFAKTDLHADDIVKIIREEFGKGNDFCQKITSKTTGKKPEDLLERVPQLATTPASPSPWT